MNSTQKVKTALFFSPSVILLVLFFVGPMLLTLVFSFTDLSLTGAAAQSTQFVGFRNFQQLFNNPHMGTIIWNTVVFLLISGIIGQQFLGFFLAYFMKHRNGFVRRFVGFTVVTGWITPEIVTAFMFGAMFGDKGSINRILETWGGTPISWLFAFPMVCVVVANIWKGSAYSMLMFQASLDGISDNVLEAADIDGANGFQTLIHVIIPQLKSTMATTFIIVTLGTLGAFGLIFAMTGGGPGIKTTTLSLFMYQKAFNAYQIGYGMAIALVILIIGVVFSLAYTKIISRKK